MGRGPVRKFIQNLRPLFHALKNYAITHNGNIISSPESYLIVKEHSSWERESIR
jgi:hypothetical protein